jgi:uncharacterized protein (TIGR02147 family)
MSHWFYVVIREMASWTEFRLEPEWIQEQLKKKVTLAEIRIAVEFLVQNGYIEVRPDGTVLPPKEVLDCKDEVLNAALIKFHRDMFALAAESIEETDDSERELVGFTFPSDPAHFAKARAILRKAMKDIENLDRDKLGEESSVYQMQMALFPLAKRSKKQ